MKIMRVAYLVLASWIYVVTIGCGGDNFAATAPSPGCSVNSDCVAPLVCAFQRCHSACADSRDCPTGTRCVIAAGESVCQLPEEATCANGVACTSGLVCAADGTCRNSCSSGADCLPSQTCAAGSCVDVATDAAPADQDAGSDVLQGDAASEDATATTDSAADATEDEAAPTDDASDAMNEPDAAAMCDDAKCGAIGGTCRGPYVCDLSQTGASANNQAGCKAACGSIGGKDVELGSPQNVSNPWCFCTYGQSPTCDADACAAVCNGTCASSAMCKCAAPTYPYSQSMFSCQAMAAQQFGAKQSNGAYWCSF